MTKCAHAMRGAVLVVSLVILLLLTLIGFAATNTSVLEVLMSFNTVRQTQSLATAENVLRVGETDVLDVTNLFAANPVALTPAYYYNHELNGTDPLETDLRDWSGFQSAAVPDPDDADAVMGRYLIEYLGSRQVLPTAENGCSADETKPGCTVYVHIVTARSETSESRGAVRIVQSVFVTDYGPMPP